MYDTTFCTGHDDDDDDERRGRCASSTGRYMEMRRRRALEVPVGSSGSGLLVSVRGWTLSATA